MSEEKNEFEEMESISDEEEQAPEQEMSEVSGGDNSEDMVVNNSGQEYDWTKAPTEGKAPPRINLGGKKTTLLKASLLLPAQDRPWLTSRDGSRQYKYCVFKLYYDIEGQQEFYSGVRVFKQKDDKYSHPSIMRDRKNQASNLLGLYADHKGKHINEVSLHEFMSFLNSKPKVLLKQEEAKNPNTGAVIQKNMVEKFL